MLERKFATFSVTIFSIISLVLCSCSKSTGDIYIDRSENIESAEIVSIEQNLPPIHSYAQVHILGDTLIIKDSKSEDAIFHVYDLLTDKYLGAFGRYGIGPGEVGNVGNLCFDRKNGNMYGLDANQWHFFGFNVREALDNPDYKPFVKIKYHMSSGIINNGLFINDTTMLCMIYSDTNRLGRLNLMTGELTTIDTLKYDHEFRCGFTVIPEEDRIIAADRTNDCMRVYTMDGKLLRSIYGPDYLATHDGGTYYYDCIVAGGDRVYAVYNGNDIMKQRFGHDIVVLDTDGNYIKTIRVNALIGHFDYHETTNRLYVSTDGDPQFGYIQL